MDTAEQHLKHVEGAKDIETVRHDLEDHFQSGGVQTTGDMDIKLHESIEENKQHPSKIHPQSHELESELQNMAETHSQKQTAVGEEPDFIRAHEGAGQFDFASEEMDAN